MDRVRRVCLSRCLSHVRCNERTRCVVCGSDLAGTQPSPFLSVDPAPPCKIADVPELQAALCDAARPLFERYRAMFALRNLNTNEAVDVRAVLRFLCC